MGSIIFSAHQKHVSPLVNKNRTKRLEDTLKLVAIDYRKLTGMYEGIEEESFIISDRFYLFADKIAYDYKQDSILMHSVQQNGLQIAFLKFTDNRPDMYLGELKSSSSRPTGDFSFSKDNNLYYYIA